jgi:hypothetical protein
MTRQGGKPASHTIYRDNRTGRILPTDVGERRNPDTVTRERMPNPGRGDTGRSDKK